jgi:hypothetical protein
MMPDTLPITAPAEGSFHFTGIIKNNTGNQISGDVWIMVGLPIRDFYGPVRLYDDIPLAPNQNIEVLGITQNVPVNAPLGFYTYLAYCGDYHDNIIDSCFFGFDFTAQWKAGLMIGIFRSGSRVRKMKHLPYR